MVVCTYLSQQIVSGMYWNVAIIWMLSTDMPAFTVGKSIVACSGAQNPKLSDIAVHVG